MKYKYVLVIIAVVMFSASISFGQEYTFANGNLVWHRYSAGWISVWGTVKVLNEGDEDCLHEWVKQNIREASMTSCAVLHDSRGCPNDWGREEWICKKCLRNIITHEDRVLIPEKEKPKSEFEILKEKIKDKK